jgi:uncharacterized protein (DUF4415 family)
MKRNSARRGRVMQGGGRTDFARLDAMTDADIDRQIADDPTVAPEWTDEMFARAQVVLPAKKVPISFRVDPDVLEHYRSQGPGYQSRMNAVLRSYMVHEQGEQTASHKVDGKVQKPGKRSTGKQVAEAARVAAERRRQNKRER